MFKRILQMTTLAVAVASLAGYGVSYAQDDDPCGEDNPCGEGDDDDDDGGGGGGMDTGGGGGSADAPGPFTWGSGAKGIATSFPTGGSGTLASYVHFMDEKTQLRLGVGLDFAKPSEGDTVIGTTIAAAYRMYKAKSGAIRPYMQPSLMFSASNFSEFADTMAVALGATIGGEWMFNDQFSLGVGTGASVSFTEKFKAITLGLGTTSITASFYWN